ncbi:hypothetical protein MA16_Dca022442 [Dendrobium catenatum]|uniref:Uncharacterized protein n=1 Tax=Dendrobium catenatum TaxID=906689 RepID=A0A2I0WHR1_9ASPA|nr:hypothetical protein MA16_Dca022442 [Dendrobium catenatum]
MRRFSAVARRVKTEFGTPPRWVSEREYCTVKGPIHAFIARGGMGPRCGTYGEAGSLISTPERGESKLCLLNRIELRNALDQTGSSLERLEPLLAGILPPARVCRRDLVGKDGRSWSWPLLPWSQSPLNELLMSYRFSHLLPIYLRCNQMESPIPIPPGPSPKARGRGGQNI